jgi:hypothetical protein
MITVVPSLHIFHTPLLRYGALTAWLLHLRSEALWPSELATRHNATAAAQLLNHLPVSVLAYTSIEFASAGIPMQQASWIQLFLVLFVSLWLWLPTVAMSPALSQLKSQGSSLSRSLQLVLQVHSTHSLQVWFIGSNLLILRRLTLRKWEQSWARRTSLHYLSRPNRICTGPTPQSKLYTSGDCLRRGISCMPMLRIDTNMTKTLKIYLQGLHRCNVTNALGMITHGNA